MSWRFDRHEINENAREATLTCYLDGLNPSIEGHSAHVNVVNNTLVVTATMGDRNFDFRIANIDVEINAVNFKLKKNEVRVIIKKPNQDYSLRSKMPR